MERKAMDDFEDIRILSVKSRSDYRLGLNTGTIDFILSHAPDDKWKDCFATAYDHMVREAGYGAFRDELKKVPGAAAMLDPEIIDGNVLFSKWFRADVEDPKAYEANVFFITQCVSAANDCRKK
jgi:hypothetical protein